jgi:hypothetical protein
MRKSLLTAIVVVALASVAAPGFAAENTQQQPIEGYAAMPNGISGVAAQETFFSPYVSNEPSATTQPGCDSAQSAKDVAVAENRCR